MMCISRSWTNYWNVSNYRWNVSNSRQQMEHQQLQMERQQQQIASMERFNLQTRRMWISIARKLDLPDEDAESEI